MRRGSGEIPGKFEELGHSNVLFALAINQDFWKKKKCHEISFTSRPTFIFFYLNLFFRGVLAAMYMFLAPSILKMIMV